MYERYLELLIENHLKSSDVSKATGIHPSTFSDWKKGKSSPKYDKLQKIADYFEVNPEWLQGSSDERMLLNDTHRKKGVKIPVLGKVAAGIPIEAIEDVLDWEEITEDMAKTGKFFALQIKGDSMSPKILEGDVVIVKQQSSADSGDIVIAIVNGFDGCCKKLIKNDVGITLQSLNPNYEPMVFTNKDVTDKPVMIVGKVVELRRKFL